MIFIRNSFVYKTYTIHIYLSASDLFNLMDLKKYIKSKKKIMNRSYFTHQIDAYNFLPTSNKYKRPLIITKHYKIVQYLHKLKQRFALQFVCCNLFYLKANPLKGVTGECMLVTLRTQYCGEFFRFHWVYIKRFKDV